MRSEKGPALIRRGFWLAVALYGCAALQAGAQTPSTGTPATQPWQNTPSGGASRPLMPDPTLEPPRNVAPVLTLYGQGVQRYVCKANDKSPGTFDWTLKEPQAKLFDRQDHEVGSHFAGPAWQLADGSKAVKKKVVATFPALESDGVPWLLVEIESTGQGQLAGTQYVQRIDTVGGAAPLTGCDSAHAGTTQDVEYRATYVFYGPRAQK